MQGEIEAQAANGAQPQTGTEARADARAQGLTGAEAALMAEGLVAKVDAGSSRLVC